MCLCRECHDEVHRRIDSGIDEVLRNSLDLSDYIKARTVPNQTLDRYCGEPAQGDPE